MIAPKIIGAGVVGLAMWLGYQTYSDRTSHRAQRMRAWQPSKPSDTGLMREVRCSQDRRDLPPYWTRCRTELVLLRPTWRTRKKPLMPPVRRLAPLRCGLEARRWMSRRNP